MFHDAISVIQFFFQTCLTVFFLPFQKVLKINASPEEILSDGPKSGKINTGCI